MSLSTQMNRGAIAVPMLALFAVLAFVAGEPVQADAKATVARIAHGRLISGLCEIEGGRSRVLVLAQAPADLGNLMVRWKVPCRA